MGYGFKYLKLNRIYAYHPVSNEASARVLAKLGMKQEGACCARSGKICAGRRQRISIRGVDNAEGQNRVTTARGGLFLESGRPFYGTRVGPGLYQGTARVVRGSKMPFSALRMLMLRRRSAWVGGSVGARTVGTCPTASHSS